MLLPPTKVTLPDVMELVTPAVLPEVPTTMPLCTVGPAIWMLLTPVVIVMLFPPEKTIVPVDVARLDPCTTLPPPPEGLGPMMVIEGLVESCDSVMFEPATKANAEDDAVLAVPEVAPPAAEVIETSADWLLAETVMMLAACPMPMLAPAEIDRLPLDPFRLVTTEGMVAEMVALPAPTPTLIMPAPDRFNRLENVPVELLVVLPRAVSEIEEVWIAGAGTEMVTLPAPTPTEAMPAPEKFNSVLNEPEELEVVLPSAVRLCVCTDCVAEIVTLPAPAPTLTMPAPERLRRLEKVPEELEVVLPSAVIETEEVCTDAEIVMLLSPEAKAMFAPVTSETLLLVPFSVKPAPPAGDGPMTVIFGLVDSWLSVIFDPATSAKAVEDAVFAVPEVAPPAADVMVVSTLAPPPPALPINWIVPAPVEIVMFEPDSTTVPVDVARFDP